MKKILKNLHLSKFIAFDFETTGLDAKKDSVIEFSATMFEDGKIKDTLNFLCNPGFEIPKEIQLLTGITTEMVKDQLPFEKQLIKVLDFFKDLPLVAHNAAFDIGFLKRYIKNDITIRLNNLPNRIYDTMYLSQAFFFYLPNHKLATVTEYCGFSAKGSHRAEVDTVNTGKIFLKLIERAMLYDYETFQTINMILEGCDDPNKWLYRNISELIILSKSVGTKKKPKIDWIEKSNFYGEAGEISEKDLQSDKICDQFFNANGKIANVLPDYEMRPQQKEMAEIILETLKKNKNCMVEAGTGVGKSLAYLLPSLIWKKQIGEESNRIVIATNTKNLQEQIFYKEIPFIFDKLKFPFKSVMLKGRSNYICLTRWNRLLSEIGYKVHISQRTAIIPIVIWLRHTITGDISVNNGFKISYYRKIWNDICSEPGYCTTNVCRKYGGCYLGKIRTQAFSSDLMIVNHSLLLADSAANKQVLPEYSVLIVDEAHNLENNAYRYFASNISMIQLKFLLDSIITEKSPERGRLVDLMQICRQLKKLNIVNDNIDKIKTDIENLRFDSEIFFKEIANEKIAKVSTSELSFGIKKRFKDFTQEFPKRKKTVNKLLKLISGIKINLSKLIDQVDEIVIDIPEIFKEIKNDLKSNIGHLDEYYNTLIVISESNNDNLIFWYEIDNRGKNIAMEINYTPLNISKKLFDFTYNELESVILTSATLQINNSFDYMKNRVGFSLFKPENVITKSVGSPFLYNEQMRFFTYHREFNQINTYNSVAGLIQKLATKINRGMLVLFTSYKALKDIYYRIEPALKQSNIKLLAQGFGSSRTAILNEFKASKNGVLLGTDSFWEGVDIIGDALQILVISKLPFAVPSEPIIEANMETINNKNKRGFIEYYVPETVLKFRQGTGRLIRSTADYGVIINLDNRVDTKRYGKLFKDSLPVTAKSIIGDSELIGAVENFFSNKHII